MRTQEPSSKFGLLPRGLINGVCNSSLIFSNLRPSLSPREGASGSVLRFSWFGEELHGKASLVWVWGPDLRSNGQKTNGFSSKSIEIPPILKTLPGYDRSRASYLGNLLSELRSDQTLLSYSRKPEKRLLLFQRCNSRGNMNAARSVNRRGLPGGGGLWVCMRRPEQLYGPRGIHDTDRTRSARAPTSPRSIGFCAIWGCISSSSSGLGGYFLSLRDLPSGVRKYLSIREHLQALR